MNYNYKYYKDKRAEEAIRKWAKAKGINPDSVLNVIYKHGGGVTITNNAGFKIKPDQPINTSVFEEAIIVE